MAELLASVESQPEQLQAQPAAPATAPSAEGSGGSCIDDDAEEAALDFAVAVAQLLALVSQAAMDAGESGPVAANPEAAAWTGGLVRTCVGAALALLGPSGPRSPRAALEALPVLNMMLGAMQRETRAGSTGAATTAGARHLSQRGGAAAAAAAGTEGRPGGVSMAPYMPRVLDV